jgi:hypothetical protein
MAADAPARPDEGGLPPAGPRPSRRAVLAGAAVAATASAAWIWWGASSDPDRPRRIVPTPPGGPPQALTADAWSTLRAAQMRLLPSAPGSPGAIDVNAIGYLDAAMAGPDVEPDTAERVAAGAASLAAFAAARGAARFADLPEEVQDEGLRAFEGRWEDVLWLRTMISFTLEAFLGDPAHGANPGEVGWTWTRHTPGFPRPVGSEPPAGRGPGR